MASQETIRKLHRELEQPPEQLKSDSPTLMKPPVAAAVATQLPPPVLRERLVERGRFTVGGAFEAEVEAMNKRRPDFRQSRTTADIAAPSPEGTPAAAGTYLLAMGQVMDLQRAAGVAAATHTRSGDRGNCGTLRTAGFP